METSAPARRVPLLAAALAAGSLVLYFGVNGRMSCAGDKDSRHGSAGKSVPAAKSPAPPGSVAGSSRFEAARRLDEDSVRRSNSGASTKTRTTGRRPALPSEGATNGAALPSASTDPALTAGPLIPTPEEALVSFESALDEMQSLADSGKRVDMKTRRRLHDSVTQSFDVLTLSVDSSDASALAQLETAYRDMRSKMAALGYDRPGSNEAPRRHRRRRRG